MRSILHVVIGLALMTGFALNHPDTSAEQTSRGFERSSLHAPSDTTIRFSVQAGEPFIFALPDTLHGQSPVRYDILRAPALSWLKGRSFYWRTVPEDVGPHTLLFQATYSQAPPDTVRATVKVIAKKE